MTVVEKTNLFTVLLRYDNYTNQKDFISMKNVMNVFGVVAMLLFTVSVNGQEMKSPPATAKGMVGKASVEVAYHQPSARGRTVMGELVPYGKVWRTGANDATKITLSEDVKVEGKTLAAGTYGLFTIPGEDEWTIIFNTDSKQWGAYDYDESKDVLRVTVSPESTDDFVEAFKIDVTKKGLSMAWENTMVHVAMK